MPTIFAYFNNIFNNIGKNIKKETQLLKEFSGDCLVNIEKELFEFTYYDKKMQN